MADYGERFTEEEFQKLRAKVEEVYREAYQDIVEKAQEWAEKHEKRARKYQRMVREGKLSKADYDAWMRGQVFQGKQWQARKQQIEQTLYHADRVAQEMANNSRFNTFAVNANFMGYELEEHGRIDTGFTLYNPNTISRLVKDQPDLLPPKRRVGRDASYRWYNRQIGTVITQGIIQGETVREIAKRIGKKTGETNCSAMLRNARTMYTGAQNAGRLEGMRQAQRLGIRVQKRWVAILDNKTRDSHQALDGQIQDVEDPFESPLGHIMYPGDTGADDPADVWNCRCSMIYEHPDYPSKLDRRDAETGEIVGDMTYKEWAAMKAERAAQAEQTAQGDNPQPSAKSDQQQPSGKSGLTESGKDGTMKVSTGGHRNEESLTPEQIKDAVDYAVHLGMPREGIQYSDYGETCYFSFQGTEDILRIGTDVLPNPNGTTANELITCHGAIAHEIVGHRATCLRGTNGEERSTYDEVQASIRAAKFADGLTDYERTLLMNDAKERATNAGLDFDDLIRFMDIWEA